MYYRNPIKIMYTTFDNPPGCLFARGIGCFCYLFSFFLLFGCKTVGPSSPEGAQLTVGGGGFPFWLFCWLFMFLLSTYPFGMTDVKLE
jgi:hypothetical protein